MLCLVEEEACPEQGGMVEVSLLCRHRLALGIREELGWKGLETGLDTTS